MGQPQACPLPAQRRTGTSRQDGRGSAGTQTRARPSWLPLPARGQCSQRRDASWAELETRILGGRRRTEDRVAPPATRAGVDEKMRSPRQQKRTGTRVPAAGTSWAATAPGHFPAEAKTSGRLRQSSRAIIGSHLYAEPCQLPRHRCQPPGAAGKRGGRDAEVGGDQKPSR